MTDSVARHRLRLRYFSGSALNFATQPFEQKWYVVPLCST